MGWVSTLEDIEEREAELKYAFETAVTKIRADTNYLAIKKAQEDVQDLANQVANHLDKRLTEILASFEVVRAALKAPGANLVGRLEKLEKTNQDLMTLNKSQEANLRKTRDRRDALQAEIDKLNAELQSYENLREENRTLKAALEGNQLWIASVSDVKPIKS